MKSVSREDRTLSARSGDNNDSLETSTDPFSQLYAQFTNHSKVNLLKERNNLFAQLEELDRELT